jgi:hypothetical protein
MEIALVPSLRGRRSQMGLIGSNMIFVDFFVDLNDVYLNKGTTKKFCPLL